MSFNNLFDLLNNGEGGIDLSAIDNYAASNSNIPTFEAPQVSEINIRFNLNGNDISLDMKGSFSGINHSGEIIRGDELKEEVRKALEEGYFQVIGFDTKTINLIDEAIYGKTKGTNLNK